MIRATFAQTYAQTLREKGTNRLRIDETTVKTCLATYSSKNLGSLPTSLTKIVYALRKNNIK